MEVAVMPRSLDSRWLCQAAVLACPDGKSSAFPAPSPDIGHSLEMRYSVWMLSVYALVG